MQPGYFFVYRKLFEHELGQNPLIVALWVRLLAEASWEDREIWWDGKAISIKRGQFITSILKLSQWLGVSRGTTKRHLNALQMIQQIDIKTTNKYTVITIRNYDKYQKNGQQTDNRLTTDYQQTDTTKNIRSKEYKNTNVPLKAASQKENPYREIIAYSRKAQELPGTYTNYVKQTTAVKKILNNGTGYTMDDIRFVIDEMIKDEFHKGKPFDMMTVANRMDYFMNRVVMFKKGEKNV